MTGGAGIVIICFLLIMATLQLLVTLILALTLSFPFPTSADNIASFFMLMWEAKQRSLTRLHPIQPESHLDVHLYIEVVSSENWIFDNILYGDEFICLVNLVKKLFVIPVEKLNLFEHIWHISISIKQIPLIKLFPYPFIVKWLYWN